MIVGTKKGCPFLVHLVRVGSVLVISIKSSGLSLLCVCVRAIMWQEEQSGANIRVEFGTRFRRVKDGVERDTRMQCTSMLLVVRELSWICS